MFVFKRDLLRLIQEDLTRSAVLVRSNVNKLPKLISNTESFLTQVGQFKSSLTDYTQQNSEIEKQARQTILNEKKLSKRTTSKQGSKFVSVPWAHTHTPFATNIIIETIERTQIQVKSTCLIVQNPIKLFFMSRNYFL